MGGHRAVTSGEGGQDFPVLSATSAIVINAVASTCSPT
jgi:hypothetical protein